MRLLIAGSLVRVQLGEPEKPRMRRIRGFCHTGLIAGPLHHLFSAANGAAGRTGKRKERFEGAMQTKGTVQKGIFLVVAVLFLLSLIPVFAMAFYAYPSADDLTYGVSTARAWQENHSLSSVVSAAWEGTMEKYPDDGKEAFLRCAADAFAAGSVWNILLFRRGASAPDWVSYLWSSASLYNFPAALFLCPSAGRHYHTRAPFSCLFLSHMILWNHFSGITAASITPFSIPCRCCFSAC